MSPEYPYATLGVDPGETTGLCLSVYPNADQCFTVLASVNLAATSHMVHALLLTHCPGSPVYAAIEKFVVSGAAIRSGHTHPILIVIEQVSKVVWNHNRVFDASPVIHIRPAVEVKRWATNERLVRAGYWTQQAHARDGARHCLYMECHDLGRRDPLSRKLSDQA